MSVGSYGACVEQSRIPLGEEIAASDEEGFELLPLKLLFELGGSV